MKTIPSHEPVLDDWVSFISRNMKFDSSKKDYAWLLDLSNYAHVILSEECSPFFREEIMREFGHYSQIHKNSAAYEI